MNYKYNQVLLHNGLLVTFIYYREDKNKIIYEYKNDLYQITPDKVTEMTKDDIINYYSAKINCYKAQIKKLRKDNLKFKLMILKQLANVQKSKKEILTVKKEIFGYNIMEATVNENICYHEKKYAIEKLTTLSQTHLNYLNVLRTFIGYKKNMLYGIYKTNKAISQYKQELKNILLNGVYMNEN